MDVILLVNVFIAGVSHLAGETVTVDSDLGQALIGGGRARYATPPTPSEQIVGATIPDSIARDTEIAAAVSAHAAAADPHGDRAYTRGYKLYSGLLTQSGTADPSVIVLENTLGAPVVWVRTALGVYTGTLAGAFPANKTFCLIGDGVPGDESRSFVRAVPDSPDRVILGTFDMSITNNYDLALDDILLNTPIEIRVYP